MTNPVQRAIEDGWNAQVGDRNPYAGEAVLAIAWRLGYKRMLARALRSIEP